MSRHPTPDVPATESLPTAAWLGVGGLVLASTVLVVALGSRPLDRQTAAAVFPPWWSQAAALTAASQAGAVTAVGALPFIVVVNAPGEDAAAKLRETGALFSINPPQGLGCGPRDA